MSIQSLSIVVPGKNCINNCKFCVSRTHEEIIYADVFPKPDIHCMKKKAYIRDLYYAKQLGCNTMMLTGECEPQQNMPFIEWLLNDVNSWEGQMDYGDRPKASIFHNIEIQTTGVGLDKGDRLSKLMEWGVRTISISMSSFDDDMNSQIISNGINKVDIYNLCKTIKEMGFMLRLSLNMNKEFYKYTPEEIFNKAASLGANQVTLRSLYKCGKDCPQDHWIGENCDREKDEEYLNYVRICGNPLEILPYGNMKYSVCGMGTVVDGDCMSKNNPNDIRYLILRPDGHLYTRWDDKGSIIF